MKPIAVILAFLVVAVLHYAHKTQSGVQFGPLWPATIDGTAQFSAIRLYTEGSLAPHAGETVNWHRSQPTVATVNRNGLASHVSICGTGTAQVPTFGMRGDV